MKHCLFALTVIAAMLQPAWAQDRIYRCGNEYTNNAAQAKERGCKLVEGGNVTVVEGTRPAAAPAGAADPESLEGSLDFIYRCLSADKAETILERLEREMIVRAIKEFSGNQVRASERLGITRATLRKRLDVLRGENGPASAAE